MAKAHYKIDELLTEESERAEYEQLARQPGTTIDDLWEWLRGKGFSIARSSVARHKRSFDELSASVRRSSETAAAFASVAKDAGIAGLADASLGRFQQLLMEKLFQMDSEEELSAGDLMKLSMALKTAVGAKNAIMDLQSKFDAVMAEKTSKRTDGTISAEDITDARKRIFGF
jgi:hypothetical protein